MVKGEDLQPKGWGFESWCHVLDGLEAKQALY